MRYGLTLAAVIGAAVFIYAWNSGSSSTPPLSLPAVAKVRGPANAAQSSTPVASVSPASEHASLQSMARLLAQFVSPDADLNGLIHTLENSGQDPEVARDINPVTGEMDIVHTRSPLTGTRYFLGQFFVDEDGKRFVQHLSFEYRPGPNAVQETIAALQSAFANLGAPSAQRGDFMEWNVGEGYVVWLKRLSEDDITQSDPDKVYSSDDVGTVRVALELKPDNQ